MRALSFFVAIVCTAFVHDASALVVHPNTLLGTPDPAAAPTSDPGWDHVGTFGTGSAVYLGENGSGESWILTAAHVGAPGTFTLGGTDYATDASVDFTNPGGGAADLRAWRLVGGPGLSNLTISALIPLAGDGITTIATGQTDGAFTCWDASWNASGCLAPAHSGYVWGGRAKQWGTNTVSPSSLALDALSADLGLDEVVFVTGFDANGTVLESQAASGDSGGGAFIQNAGEWELVGVPLAIGSIPPDASRPGSTAVLADDYTFYADLSYYRDQIAAGTGVPVPEPGSAALVALGLVGLAARRREAGAARL